MISILKQLFWFTVFCLPITCSSVVENLPDRTEEQRPDAKSERDRSSNRLEEDRESQDKVLLATTTYLACESPNSPTTLDSEIDIRCNIKGTNTDQLLEQYPNISFRGITGHQATPLNHWEGAQTGEYWITIEARSQKLKIIAQFNPDKSIATQVSLIIEDKSQQFQEPPEPEEYIPLNRLVSEDIYEDLYEEISNTSLENENIIGEPISIDFLNAFPSGMIVGNGTPQSLLALNLNRDCQAKTTNIGNRSVNASNVEKVFSLTAPANFVIRLAKICGVSLLNNAANLLEVWKDGVIYKRQEIPRSRWIGGYTKEFKMIVNNAPAGSYEIQLIPGRVTTIGMKSLQEDDFFVGAMTVTGNYLP